MARRNDDSIGAVIRSTKNFKRGDSRYLFDKLNAYGVPPEFLAQSKYQTELFAHVKAILSLADMIRIARRNMPRDGKADNMIGQLIQCVALDISRIGYTCGSFEGNER